MPLTKLQFRPGVNRETTSYTNEGGWFDCDKVRFRFGTPEKIGGWEKRSANSYLGTARALHPFVALNGTNFLGIGTHLKYYIDEGGAFNDVTPIRTTTSAGDVTFAVPTDTLSAAIAATDVTIGLSSVSGFASSGFIKINSEEIFYAGISGTDLVNCLRGQKGTTAAAHSSGDAVTTATITVTDTAHGALQNDFVTFSGAAALGGNMTADVLNQEYQIQTIETTNTYTIRARTAGTSISSITEDGQIDDTLVYSTSSDTGNGGSSTVGTYQINTGLDTVVLGTGWGAGTWGRGTWGSGASVGISVLTLRIWSHDNFGEDLIINVRNGGIYYWDKSTSSASPFGRAVAISDLAGADATTPTIAKQVLVSDRDRHIIAFGCDPENNVGVQDPLLIRFSSQGSPTTWESLPTNTAGDLRVGSGSEIVAAVETRQQILVFTDASLHAMQFLGPPFTFGINLVSENITTAGPLCAVAVEDAVFWMGREEFYVFNGQVQKLPCSVRSYVFNDFNFLQTQKVTAALNSSYSEIWWFYPSANSDTIDRYVVYNYQEKVWYYGTMTRSVWLDRGINQHPIAAGLDGYLYTHEIGQDDGSTSPASPISAYIESSQVDIGDGENFVFMRRLIPDLTFNSSSAENPAANFVLKTRNFPGGQYLQTSTDAVTRSATVPVEQFTDQVHVRLRGRSFALKIESSDTGVAWRLGSPRVDIRQDGRR
jgi:hypothetical protein